MILTTCQHCGGTARAIDARVYCLKCGRTSDAGKVGSPLPGFVLIALLVLLLELVCNAYYYFTH